VAKPVSKFTVPPYTFGIYKRQANLSCILMGQLMSTPFVFAKINV
jgi:hypothetical protein